MTLPDHNEADDFDHEDNAPDAFLPQAEREALDKFDAELDLEPDEDEDEFKDEAAVAQTKASAELAALDAELNAPTFYEAGSDLHALDDLNLAGRVSVLERLGPAHFRSRGFSFMGFLQTVYDHVGEQLKKDASGIVTPQAIAPEIEQVEIPPVGIAPIEASPAEVVEPEAVAAEPVTGPVATDVEVAKVVDVPEVTAPDITSDEVLQPDHVATDDATTGDIATDEVVPTVNDAAPCEPASDSGKRPAASPATPTTPAGEQGTETDR